MLNTMSSVWEKLKSSTKTPEQRRNHLLRQVVDDLQTATDASLIYYNKILEKTELLENKYSQEKKKVKELTDYFSASEVLLQGNKNFEDQLKDALPLIIKGTKHDRIWVYKKIIDEIHLVAASVDEENVISKGIIPLPEIYKVKDFPMCETHTFKGIPVYISKDSLPEESLNILPQNILSISALPIFTGNNKKDVWGIIGLSNYTSTRLPNESERQILSSFSNIISLCLKNSIEC